MNKKFFRTLFNASHSHLILFNPDTSMESIRRYIRSIRWYNGFNPGNVLRMVDHIDKVVPKQFYNEGNLNNGRRLWYIEIGREQSPVIYITIKVKSLSYDNIQAENALGIILECESAALKAGADVINNKEEKSSDHRYIRLRFWWD